VSNNTLATKGLAFQKPALSFNRSITIGLDTPMIRDADFLQPERRTYAAQVSVSGWPSV